MAYTCVAKYQLDIICLHTYKTKATCYIRMVIQHCFVKKEIIYFQKLCFMCFNTDT